MEDSSVALGLNLSILTLSTIFGLRVSNANNIFRLQLCCFIVYTLLSSAYFNLLPGLAFPSVLVLIVTMFSSYFSKLHPYRLEISKTGMKFKDRTPNYMSIGKTYHSCFKRTRDIWDPVIYTNLAFLIFGLCSFFIFKQWELAVLQMFTFIGSSFYHFSKEANYFNLDQTFAGSLGCIFLLSIYDAYALDLDYFLVGGFVALPVGIFLFDYCGMPADVIYEPFCCVRQGRLLYDQIHSIWHIASAFAPLGCSYFYSKHSPQENLVLGRGYLDESTMCFPIVPVYALLISLMINIVGNAVGIFPPR